ncbi:MAG: site-specific DNA-methyltransferase [Halobacteriovoraceae bacterium]|nr:site-specific DNA-methyltransferase [Halobacteriovoraceae bacterium]|tara:strand:+ start:5362 stop:6966 length:1605 start_codon:yes stop_codon:yes gene_type:complete
MSYKQRLELDWIGKDDIKKIEPRILIEDEKYSFGISSSSKKEESNLLIKGDNLLALKALESEYKGKVKCVTIDPPYNTGSAFEHYDDGLEHSIWLSLIRDRLMILRELLSDDGSIWITIDDNEAHYLKVLCDEIFGRSNFVASFVWQKTLTRRNDARTASTAHDYVITYCKNREFFKMNKLEASEKIRSTYTNRDDDPRGDWLAIPFHAPNIRPNLTYPIVTPSGRTLMPPAGRCWSTTEEKFQELLADNRIYFGRDGNGMAQRKKFWAESENTMVAWTWWPYQECGDNREANKEAKEIAKLAGIQSKFSTPKPEKLLKRIIELATVPGDIVLDSFAGSGTAGAVAHKMNRKWIMIEMGDHCEEYIVPRMVNIINGKDNVGISKEVGWSEGGSFRFCNLAPSLLNKDNYGNWVINNEYNAIQLAEAVCKHEKFKFHPHDSVYWKQGYSSEKDFIFVTTQFLTAEHIDKIHNQLGKDESLLICAKAFKIKKDKYQNITMKKIPQMLFGRCEFNKNDYSLNIKEPVQEEFELGEEA